MLCRIIQREKVLSDSSIMKKLTEINVLFKIDQH